MSAPTSSRIRNVVVTAALVALIAFLAAAVLERREVERDRGFRGPARTNPYFALNELFGALGVPSEAIVGTAVLPPTDHALIVASAERRSVERLLDWTADGGHLLVVPAAVAGDDSLIESLGVSLFYEDGADDDDHESMPEYASDRPDWPRLWAWEETEVIHSEGASDASWTVTVRHGEGRATIFATGGFLRNDTLEARDHALIAWEALTRDGVPSGVTLVYRDPRPSLLAVLTSRARPLAISLAVLAVVALAAFARRFGPRRAPPERARRHLGEHVQATGDYLWTVGCEDSLIRATREALARHLGRGHVPSDAALGPLIDRAADTAAVDPAALHVALQTTTMRDRAGFARIIQLFETVRRKT